MLKGKEASLSAFASCAAALAASLAALLKGSLAAAGLALAAALLCALAALRGSRTSRAARLELDAAKEELGRRVEGGHEREQSALALGSSLSASTVRTLSLIHRLEGLASGTSDGIAVLNESLAQAVQAQDATIGSHARLQETLGSYSHEVTVESAAIQEMVGSAKRLAASSGGKDKEMRNLLERASGAEGMLSSIQRATEKIMETARKTEEMNVRIADLSERTNLLAINASIEAAHVGRSGGGFAIIATQIKSLSEESRSNSRAITAAIGETLASIEATAHAADSATEYFRNVVAEIGELDGTFEDLLSEINTLSDGSSKLLESVSLIGELNTDSGKALRSSAESLTGSRDSLHQVNDIAASIQSDAGAMMAAFKEGVAEAARAKDIGAQVTATLGTSTAPQA